MDTETRAARFHRSNTRPEVIQKHTLCAFMTGPQVRQPGMLTEKKKVPGRYANGSVYALLSSGGVLMMSVTKLKCFAPVVDM